MSLKISLGSLGEKIIQTRCTDRTKMVIELSHALQRSVFTPKWAPSNWRQSRQGGKAEYLATGAGLQLRIGSARSSRIFGFPSTYVCYSLETGESLSCRKSGFCSFAAQVVCVGAKHPPCSGRWVPTLLDHRAVDVCSCKSTFSVLCPINEICPGEESELFPWDSGELLDMYGQVDNMLEKTLGMYAGLSCRWGIIILDCWLAVKNKQNGISECEDAGPPFLHSFWCFLWCLMPPVTQFFLDQCISLLELP